MSQWRKLPVIIDAVRFAPHVVGSEWVANRPQWLVDAINAGNITNPASPDSDGEYCLVNVTLGTAADQAVRCDAGDWIIRGVGGELYPCKPDIFELTYEAAAL